MSLQFRFSTLRDTLARMPMVRALPPLATGILLADGFDLPLWFLGTGFLLCGAVAIGARCAAGTLATLLALLLFGFGLGVFHRPTPPAYGTPGEYELLLHETLSEQSNYTTTAAELRSRRDASTGQWQATKGSLILRTDSTLQLTPGTRIAARGTIHPLPANGYGRLMLRRGYVGTLRLYPAGLLATAPPRHPHTLAAFAARLHEAAVRRIDRLDLSPEARTLTQAMVTGDRHTLPDNLRQAYATSGTAHLLSVSGLHVGIVFLLINLLLAWLPLVRRGHLLRNLLVIALIWLYALSTGLAPSVVRSALMFSALQLALFASSEYVAMNTLAAAATVMLLYNPHWLFDLSFQLSFLAVGAIIAWGVPACRALRWQGHRPWHRAVNFLSSSVTITLIASAATAPLIAHTFHQLPLLALAINPVAILLSYVVVGAGTLWLTLPGTWAAPLFEAVIGRAAEWQNALILRAAEWPAAATEATLSAAGCAAIYGAMVAASLILWCVERKKSVPLFP